MNSPVHSPASPSTTTGPRKVLLVDDVEEFYILVDQALRGTGIQLQWASNASEATKAIHSDTFDLILLDVNLPDENGFSLCEKWQNEATTRDIPIFFVTGRTDLTNKILGFSKGADDYITKPIEPLELRARIEAKLKKTSKASPSVFRKGDLQVNLPLQQVWLLDASGEQHNLNLTPAEFRIFYYLAVREGQIISKEELLSNVWGKEVHIVDHNIYTHVSSLRRKLLDKATYIESVPKAGYRFTVR